MPQNTNSTDDIVYSASIDDKTSAFFDDLDKQFAESQKMIDEWSTDVDSRVKQTGVEIGLVGGIVAALTTKLLEMGAQGLQAFTAFLKSSVDLRARVDTLGISLNTVGVNAGYTVDQLAKYEESVKQRGITTRQARDSLIQMAQAELDLSKSSDLARVSQDAAVNAGITSADAFDRITRAIVTLQPEILRNLNLNVNMEAAYSKYALSVNKTASELSFGEKKQAAMNAVLQAGATIAGTYENAMGSVGKLLTSLPRFLEEIQYQLGGMFQPGYLALVTSYKDLLGEILDLLKSNKDDMEDLARTAGVSIELIVSLLKQFADMLGTIIKIGSGMSGINTTFDEMTASLTTLNDALTKVVAVFSGLDAVLKTNAETIEAIDNLLANANIFKFTEKMVKSLGAYVDMLKAVASGDLTAFSEAEKRFTGINDVVADSKTVIDAFSNSTNVGKTFMDAYNKSLAESDEILKKYAKSTDDAKDSSDKFAQILAMKLEDAIALTSGKLKQLQEDLNMQAAERQIQLQRQAIEEELKAQWQNEDRERTHQERVQQIIENAEESKKRLVEQAAEARVNIEQDYRERLQDIQEEFNYNASELARKRDAVGLLALIRQNKKQLSDEKDAYEDRRKKAEESFKKATEQLDKSLQEQLKKADEARAKEIENYQRNLDRQKVLKKLHDKWEEEDRQRAQQKALLDIVKFYSGLDGSTREGLTRILQTWGWYFSSLDAAINQYNNQTSASVGALSADQGIRALELQIHQDVNGDGRIGQAGQVSQMLSPSHLGNMSPGMLGNVSRVPAVPSGGNNSNTRVIRFEGNVEGLDPYLQRVMVNALLEIERNNG